MNEPRNGMDAVRVELTGLRERMTSSEVDRREIWREQGRAQERLAGHDVRLDTFETGQERLETKVDGHGKLLWGIFAAVLTLLLAVIGNLVILLSQGGGTP